MEVSVIIVVRNEEIYILNCIKSIENQFEDEKDWELIIVDGQSNDQTVQLVKNYLEYKKYNWKILTNPLKTLASGWNIGIKQSKGKYVIRPDAHAILKDNYINIGLQILKNNSEIAAVGGVLVTMSNTSIGDVIATAFSLRIAVGTSFRTNHKSCYSETVVYAIYRKEIFEKVGYFDESLIRHQDNDLHKRIRKFGLKLWQESKMIAVYYSRNTYKKLVKQMYNIGLNLPFILFRGAVSYRHIIPFLFYSLNIFLIVLGLINKKFYFLFLLIFGLYFLLVLITTIKVVLNKRNILYLKLLYIILTMHFFYFLGTLIGFFKFIKVKLIC